VRTSPRDKQTKHSSNSVHTPTCTLLHCIIKDGGASGTFLVVPGSSRDESLYQYEWQFSLWGFSVSTFTLPPSPFRHHALPFRAMLREVAACSKRPVWPLVMIFPFRSSFPRHGSRRRLFVCYWIKLSPRQGDAILCAEGLLASLNCYPFRFGFLLHPSC